MKEKCLNFIEQRYVNHQRFCLNNAHQNTVFPIFLKGQLLTFNLLKNCLCSIKCTVRFMDQHLNWSKNGWPQMSSIDHYRLNWDHLLWNAKINCSMKTVAPEPENMESTVHMINPRVSSQKRDPLPGNATTNSLYTTP